MGVAAAAALVALLALGLVEVVARDEDQATALALLGPLLLLLDGEGGLGVEVEVAVALDVAAVEVGDLLGRAEGDVDQERHRARFAHVAAEGLERARDLGVAREDLLEVGVGAAVRLHHVEHHLIDAVRPEEPVDVEHVGEVAIGDHRRGVELDAEALELGHRVEAGERLLEAVGRPGEPLVELLLVAVDRDVEAVHPRLRQRGGVGQVAEPAAVGHHADAAVAERFGPADELGQLGARRRLARGEAHLLGAAVALEDPADAIGRHRRVVDVAAVAVFFHAEDAVVVADGADRDVDALVLRREAFDDGGGLGDHGCRSSAMRGRTSTWNAPPRADATMGRT